MVILSHSIITLRNVEFIKASQAENESIIDSKI